MAQQYYILPLVIDTAANGKTGRFPKYVLGQSQRLSVMDYGAENVALVMVEADQTVHDSLAAQQDAWQFPQDLTSNIIARDVTALTTFLNRVHVPTAWIQTGLSYRAILAKIAEIFQFAQRHHGLHNLAVRESRTLDTAWDELPLATRTRLTQTADSLGYDKTEFASGRTLETTLTSVVDQFGDDIRLGDEELKPRTRAKSLFFSAQALPASDSFTGTNGTHLNSYSSNWTQIIAALDIQSNAVAPDDPGSNGGAYGWNADTFDNDHYSKGTIVAASSAAFIGLTVRGSTGSGGSAYYYTADNGSDGSYLDKVVNGSYTLIDFSSSGGFSVNDVVRLEVEGTQLRPIINDSADPLGNSTDSSLSSGMAGLGGWGDATSIRIDNWEGGNLGGVVYEFSAAINITSSTPATDATVERQLVANVAKSTSTPNIDATAERQLSAQVDVTTATPDDVAAAVTIITEFAAAINITSSTPDTLSSSVERQLTGQSAVASSTPGIDTAVERQLVGQVAVGTTTSAVNGQVERQLLAQVNMASSTPDDIVVSQESQLQASISIITSTPAIDTVVERQLMGSSAIATTTPAVDATAERQLLAQVDIASATPDDVAASVSGITEFQASAAISTSTPDTLNATVERQLVVSPGITSSTTDSDSAAERKLTAQIAISASTSAVSVTSERHLSAQVDVATSTPALDGNVERQLVATVSVVTVTPNDVAATSSGQIYFSAAINAVSQTPDTVSATAERQIIGQVNLASSTEDAVQPSVERRLIAAVAVQSSTPGIDASAAATFAATMSIAAVTSTTVQSVVVRKISGTIVLLSSTPDDIAASLPATAVGVVVVSITGKASPRLRVSGSQRPTLSASSYQTPALRVDSVQQ